MGHHLSHHAGALGLQAAHAVLRQPASGARLFQAGAAPGIFRRLAAILLARAPMAVKPFMSSSAASPHSLRLLGGLVASASLASAAWVQQQQHQQQHQHLLPSSSTASPAPPSFASSRSASPQPAPSSSSPDAPSASPRVVPFAFKTSNPLQPGTSLEQVNTAFSELGKDPTGMYGWASVDRNEAAGGRVEWGGSGAATGRSGAEDSFLLEFLNHGLKPSSNHGVSGSALAGASMRAAGAGAPAGKLAGRGQENSGGAHAAPVWASGLSEQAAILEWSGVTAAGAGGK
jgi:hypothetical protein